MAYKHATAQHKNSHWPKFAGNSGDVVAIMLEPLVLQHEKV